MSEVQEALHAATKLGAFLEQFARAKSVLETAAHLEQETASLTQRRDAAILAAGDAEARVVAARKTLQELGAQIEASRQFAADLRATAEGTAAEITAKAEGDAAQILEAARAREQAAHQREAHAVAEATAVEAKRDAAQAELVRTLESIEAAKADARARFGG